MSTALLTTYNDTAEDLEWSYESKGYEEEIQPSEDMMPVWRNEYTTAVFELLTTPPDTPPECLFTAALAAAMPEKVPKIRLCLEQAYNSTTKSYAKNKDVFAETHIQSVTDYSTKVWDEQKSTHNVNTTESLEGIVRCVTSDKGPSTTWLSTWLSMCRDNNLDPWKRGKWVVIKSCASELRGYKESRIAAYTHT